LVRDADQAASTSAVFICGFPFIAGARFRFPALSLLPGASPDHELKFAAVGNCFMSGPLSARIVAAACERMPGIVCSNS
jgi:hypothetical protein